METSVGAEVALYRLAIKVHTTPAPQRSFASYRFSHSGSTPCVVGEKLTPFGEREDGGVPEAGPPGKVCYSGQRTRPHHPGPCWLLLSFQLHPFGWA